jgi:ATP-dependent helicase/nuclease subunit B
VSEAAPLKPALNTAAAHLERLTAGYPLTRKRLIAGKLYARELLLTLARTTGGWIGWEATTLRELAEELAFTRIGRDKLKPASDAEVAALVNEAISAAHTAGEFSDGTAALIDGPGLRTRLRDSVLELRTAGIAPAEVARLADGLNAPATRDVATTLRHYERLLAERGLVDPAELFHLALAEFDEESQFVFDGPVVIASGMRAGGLPGRLVERLIEHGATVLPDDLPDGLEPPPRVVAGERGSSQPHPVLRSALARTTQAERPEVEKHPVEIFHAATPTTEILEVFRRAAAEGLRYDEVEIVTTDPDTYGIALDSVARQIDGGYTTVSGLPLTRARVGAALERWLQWLSNGLPADLLREALESGDIASPDPEVPAGALAQMLRDLRIGWGRARYEEGLLRLRDPRFVQGGRHDPENESESEFAERVTARRRTAHALTALIERLLESLPPFPERGEEMEPETTPETIARAAIEFLRALKPESGGESKTRDRLVDRLEQIAEVATPPTLFSSAMAALRDQLSDFRAWPSAALFTLPRESTGGAVHLTTLEHAGAAGRARTFFVGLDVERTAGPQVDDALLPDAIRRRSGELPTTADRRAERAFALGTALARSRGKVTLSFARASGATDRPADPAPLLLQVFRTVRGDPTLTYEAFHNSLGSPASAVPLPPSLPVSDRDVWLEALGSTPVLLNGTALVREKHALLAAGLDALNARRQPTAGAHHGITDVGPQVHEHVFGRGVVSPSSLEKLSQCPLAWFYRYALRLRVPEDPEYDEETWLDPAERGSLLHTIFERFVARYFEDPAAVRTQEAKNALHQITRDTLREWRTRVPPPSEFVADSESKGILESARAFYHMLSDSLPAEGEKWLAVEQWFPEEGKEATYALPDGTGIRIHGRMDRVDQRADGTLVVVDYKTGSDARYRKKKVPFHGGRQIQPAIYAEAAAQLFGAQSVGFEYHFPTDRGKNEVVDYKPHELAGAREIVADVIAQVKTGAFIPTYESDDCRYCEYLAMCRGSVDEYEKVKSPPADWAKEHAGANPVYVSMRRRRGAK